MVFETPRCRPMKPLKMLEELLADPQFSVRSLDISLLKSEKEIVKGWTSASVITFVLYLEYCCTAVVVFLSYLDRRQRGNRINRRCFGTHVIWRNLKVRGRGVPF